MWPVRVVLSLSTARLVSTAPVSFGLTVFRPRTFATY